MLRSALPILIVLLLVAAAGSAQNAPAASQPLRAFIDCSQVHCDYDFFRTSIAFVDHVRDRNDADVHILVTRRRAGSGGHQYTASFIGLGRYAGMRDTLQYFATQDATDDMIRRGLVHIFKLGLIPFLGDSPVTAGLTIGYSPPSGAPTEGVTQDPWHHWVFRAHARGNFSGESSSHSSSIYGSFAANHTTDRWKVNVGLSGSYHSDFYRLDSASTVTSTTNSYGAQALAVRSLGRHWGIAGAISASHSSYLNRRLALRAAPGLEYDFFPYRESTRRILVVRYEVGLNRYEYEQPTIFDKRAETLTDESLQAYLLSRQPWGSVEVLAQAGHYFSDFRENQVSAEASLSIRLLRGLSVELDGQAERVHNQRYLPQQGATTEEILLQRRAVATSYRYDLSVGLSYSFGSIFNDVVNPRFGNDGAGLVID